VLFRRRAIPDDVKSRPTRGAGGSTVRAAAAGVDGVLPREAEGQNVMRPTLNAELVRQYQAWVTQRIWVAMRKRGSRRLIPSVATDAGEHLRHSFQVDERSPRLVALVHIFANIINYSAPESGIIKLQRNDHISVAEHSACAVFRSVQPEERVVEETPKALVVSALKKRKVARRGPYVHCRPHHRPQTKARGSSRR
jgi:hypothetical protein